MDIKENVTTVVTTSAEVHTTMTGRAANAFVLANAHNTTPLTTENAHALAIASVHHTTV